MTPYQRGQAALVAEIDRFSNPYPMGPADWASWRNGHNAAQTAPVHARKQGLSTDPTRASRSVHSGNMNLKGR